MSCETRGIHNRSNLPSGKNIELRSIISKKLPEKRDRTSLFLGSFVLFAHHAAVGIVGVGPFSVRQGVADGIAGDGPVTVAGEQISSRDKETAEPSPCPRLRNRDS